MNKRLDRQALRVLMAPGLWVLSVCYGLWCTLADSFVESGSTMWLTQHPAEALLRLAIRVAAAFAVCALLRVLLALPGKNGTSEKALWPRFSLLLLLCWLPYAFVLWPGTVSNDSNTQLYMIMGMGPMTADNPIAQIGLLALFRAMGLKLESADAGVALYCMVQTGCMIALFGRICACVWARASRPIGVLCVIFYALHPIFPVYAMCVGKDTNFGMAVTWLMLLLWESTETEKPGRGLTVRLCIASALCVALRNAGIGIVLITAAIWAIDRLRRHAGIRLPAAAAAAGVTALLIVKLIAVPLSGAVPGKTTEYYSVPLQQAARIAVTDGLSDAERTALSGVIDPDAMCDAYQPILSDPVKDLWNQTADAGAQSAFFRCWLHMAAKHPLTAASATFHNVYGYLYPGYVNPLKPSFIIGANYSSLAPLGDAYPYSINIHAERVKGILNGLLTYRGTAALLSPGLYGWLCILFFVLARKKSGARLCMLPVLCVLAGCLFSAVNGYFRYALPVYMSIGLCAGICASALNKERN